ATPARSSPAGLERQSRSVPPSTPRGSPSPTRRRTSRSCSGPPASADNLHRRVASARAASHARPAVQLAELLQLSIAAARQVGVVGQMSELAAHPGGIPVRAELLEEPQAFSEVTLVRAQHAAQPATLDPDHMEVRVGEL